jgi:hypothetical protein
MEESCGASMTYVILKEIEEEAERMTIVRKGKRIAIIEIITGTVVIEMIEVGETERETGTRTGTEIMRGIEVVIMKGIETMIVTVTEDINTDHIRAQGGQRSVHGLALKANE